jgi:hypothetical protein
MASSYVGAINRTPTRNGSVGHLFWFLEKPKQGNTVKSLGSSLLCFCLLVEDKSIVGTMVSNLKVIFERKI